jgi:hypothetical protein
MGNRYGPKRAIVALLLIRTIVFASDCARMGMATPEYPAPTVVMGSILVKAAGNLKWGLKFHNFP